MQLFSKILSNTDIRERLAVPTKALDHFSFPGEHDHCVRFLVSDSAQTQWNFRLAKRQAGNHPKPEITGDWKTFVEAKGLKMGDQVILYKLGDEYSGVHYRIAVKKLRLKLLGTGIYADED